MSFPNHKKDHLVTVKTDFLREKLNSLYETIRSNPSTMNSWGRFDYLWDLKEMALIQGLSSIDIPFNWLEELEQVRPNHRESYYLGH